MKTNIILLFFIAGILFANNYKIISVTGDVFVRKGFSENIEPLNLNYQLTNKDLVISGDKSSIKLKINDTFFLMKENSALNLKDLKVMSLDEMLLALAMEDIRKIPVKSNKSNIKNTAVYGEKKIQYEISKKFGSLGGKLLEGAKQLAENGFKESAIVTVLEIYRTYPETKKMTEERLFFTDLLIELGLYEEAADELSDISNYIVEGEFENEINDRIEIIKEKFIEN